MKNQKRLGVLGGTFDPIHTGHLILAEQVREKLQLEQIIFIPCASPPHKTERELSPADYRLEMTRLALEENSCFFVSDIELKRKGLSYTVETLRELRELYKDSEMFFLTGSDVLDEITTWKNPEEIYRLAKIVIAVRPGFDKFDPEDHFARRSIIVKITGMNVSSTQIREKVKSGQSIKYLVPQKVEEYIKNRGLYKE